MSNFTPSRPGLKQGGSDARELFMDIFSGEILTAYNGKTVMRELHTVKSLTSAKAHSFPLVWKTNANYHTPGTELTGSAIAHQEVLVTPDDKLIADVFIPDIDEVMNHFDVRGPYANELAQALAKKFDPQVMRAIIKAARSSAQFTGGDGGGNVIKANARTVAGDLYDAILDAKLVMENKFVDVDGTPLHCVLAPAQFSLLARSDKFINRDFGNDGTVRAMKLTTVDGVGITKAPYATLVYGVNSSADSTIPTYYRDNFANTVCTVFTPQAVATAEVQGVSAESEYSVRHQGTLMTAKQMSGTRVLRPEAAVEIKTA